MTYIGPNVRCGVCGTVYPLSGECCPAEDCGRLERDTCMVGDALDLAGSHADLCDDLATGFLVLDGEEIAACDDHREVPF